jgi:phosphoglycerate dehydrogenase-like enzyme
VIFDEANTHKQTMSETNDLTVGFIGAGMMASAIMVRCLVFHRVVCHKQMSLVPTH